MGRHAAGRAHVASDAQAYVFGFGRRVYVEVWNGAQHVTLRTPAPSVDYALEYLRRQHAFDLVDELQDADIPDAMRFYVPRHGRRAAGAGEGAARLSWTRVAA